MIIQNIPLEKIKPNDWNPNRLTEDIPDLDVVFR